MANLSSTFVVLGPDQSAAQVPVTPAVYEELDRRVDRFRGRLLVAMHTFESDWPTWEMHPKGDEVVTLVSGRAEMVLEEGGRQEAAGGRQMRSVRLENPGDFVVVPRGTWHTAKIATPTTMMFVTPGESTENEAR